GPPSDDQDRTASIATQPAGSTSTAAASRRPPTGAASSHQAATDHGIQGRASSPAMAGRNGPVDGSSQWCTASRKPTAPNQPRTAASRRVGAARTASSHGTSPNQASHHSAGAGKA